MNAVAEIKHISQKSTVQHDKGLSIKDVRTQRRLSSADFADKEEGGFSNADFRTFWCKKLRIFRNFWCVRTDRGGVTILC